jgi:hypothetical protein
MKEYCKLRLGADDPNNYGHWHYAHFYYSQVRYRDGGDSWRKYRAETYPKLVAEATPVDTDLGPGCYWAQGYIGKVYTTALNLIVLQMDNAVLPIYQR